MATEKLLIDANDLKKSKTYMWDNALGYCECVLMDDIDNAPTVDAVEVVRCKDCKKWFRHTEVDRERGECRRYQTTKRENGYCDRGERKDNGR